MKEVLPGVYQITLTLSGFSPGSVNIYLIESNNGFTMVDTGWDSPPAIESLVRQLAEIGVGITDIKRVIITHFHIDHLGMISRFCKSHNPAIYIHENEIKMIKIRYTGGDNYLPLTDNLLQTHGFPASELAPPDFQFPIPDDLAAIQYTGLFKGGEEIQTGKYTLRVINTPGHTPGHVVFYEPQKKFVVSGDMLLPTIAPNAAFHVQHMQNPLQQYLKSLEGLRELDIDLVFPGHEYIYSNPRPRIAELFHHHEERASEIWQVFNDHQPKNAYEVSQVLSWSPRLKTTIWNKLSSWDKRFAVLQTIAHLEEMRFAKFLTRFSQNGKLYYR
jgi:glyoxylase-like metal-dependent hydrolase (beta-lactamase superfamily II)